MAKEKCVMCGDETIYDVSTHIDMRVGYIEGAGQLCQSCFNSTTNTNINTSYDIYDNNN